MPVRIHPPPETTMPLAEPEERYVPPAPDPSREPLFSALVPAWNEAESLESAVRGLVAAFEEVGEPFEILVVDDGSRDGTGAAAAALAGADPRIKALRHERNRGLGAAIRTGVQAARGTYVVGSPADSPLDAAQIRAFLDAMEPRAAFAYLPGKRAVDVAVGFRVRRPGYRGWARFCSWVYRWMLRVAFWTWLRDFNWISMYRRTVFDTVRIEHDNFLAVPEILIKAKRAGLVLRQVPCPMKPRTAGRGTVGRLSMPFRAFGGMLRLWWHLHFGSGESVKR